MRGKFLVLEGVDGSGKSTQADAMMSWLQEAGRNPLHLREPGTTIIGEQLRSLLLDPNRAAWDAETEALLFFAARRELLRQEIAPALTEGRDVICERFTPSTLAYQGQGEGVSNFVLNLDSLVVPPDLQPGLVLILDLAPEESLARAKQCGQPDAMEARGTTFQEGVRRGYHAYASARPEQSHWLDVTGMSPEQVFDALRPPLQRFFQIS
tara:strand:+ start:29 stop:658 length:630 start_codon:yes stop_codon:yes gene_type:complete